LVATAADGRVDPGQIVVVTVTGHGLKDVDTASAAYGDVRPDVVPPDVRAAASVLGLA
jgi:threonine synthase